MILYHFTDFWSLQNAGPDAILTAGLKAHDPNDDYPMFAGKLRPCVWLTSAQELPPMFQKSGAQEVRVTVDLSTASKRLVSWPKILQRAYRMDKTTRHIYSVLDHFEEMERDRAIKHDLGREPTDAELKAWRYWWLHFGDIPLKNLREVRGIKLQHSETAPSL